MITLTAHLENGKKYSFEIPEGYPWVEYDDSGDVSVWNKKPVKIYSGRWVGSFYDSDQPNGAEHIDIGVIPECRGHKTQLQRIQFHD